MDMTNGSSMNGSSMGGDHDAVPDSADPSSSGMKMMDGHMMPADDSIAMMMMQMTFYAGVDCTVLIKQWKTSNAGELLGTVIFWFLIALLHQGTKRLRRSLQKRHNVATSRGGFAKLNEQEGSPVQSPGPEVSIVEAPNSWGKLKNHLLQSILQLVQTTTSFLLMLVFMTYNVWLAVAIVLGDMCGYMIFSYDTPDTSGGCG